MEQYVINTESVLLDAFEEMHFPYNDILFTVHHSTKTTQVVEIPPC